MFCEEQIIGVYSGNADNADGFGVFVDYYDKDLVIYIEPGHRFILETEHYLISVEEGGTNLIHKAGRIEDWEREGEYLQEYIRHFDEDESPFVHYEATLFLGQRLLRTKKVAGQEVLAFDDLTVTVICHESNVIDIRSSRRDNEERRVYGADRLLARKCDCGASAELYEDFALDFHVRCPQCGKTFWDICAIGAIEGWNKGIEDDIHAKEPYKNVYSEEAANMNKKLMEECVKKTPNFEVIEALLQQGADPLGGTSTNGIDACEHVYGEIVYGSGFWWDNDGSHIPRITRLFLEYGMDVDNPRVLYNYNSTNPMWSFAFASNEYGIMALEMLLNKGISVESVDKMVDEIEFQYHYVIDDPNENDTTFDVCTWKMKMLMLCASYDYLLDNYEMLSDLIGCDYNDYDIHKFRNWNDFDYEFDTSHCKGEPSMIHSVVNIYEKASRKRVWRIGMYMNEEMLHDAGITLAET